MPNKMRTYVLKGMPIIIPFLEVRPRTYSTVQPEKSELSTVVCSHDGKPCSSTNDLQFCSTIQVSITNVEEARLKKVPIRCGSVSARRTPSKAV
jgi:hypothetical protein